MTLSGASLLDQLSAVEESGFDAIQKARNPDMLEVARVHYLGRNGQLARLDKGLMQSRKV